MTLATPCDACGRPLHRDVVTVRFAAVSTASITSAAGRTVTAARQAYLVCQGCAAYVQACITVLEQRGAAEDVEVKP